MNEASRRWYLADRDDPRDLSTRVFEYIEELERSQSFFYERYHRLNCIYDLYHRMGTGAESADLSDRRVTENVVASCVDTVVGIIATAEIRPRILIDDGDWTAHRTAARLSWYAEGLSKVINAHALGVSGFKAASLKGTGLAKVDVDWQSMTICAEPVLVEDIVLPDFDSRAGKKAVQMHHRTFVDKEELKRAHPEQADEIDSAQAGTGSMTSAGMWAGYREIESEHIVCVESWYLPYGTRGKASYKAGRHCKVIDGHVLLDEEYHEDYFPFAVMRWTERDQGWYGIGGGERIAGHQRQLNRLHHQVDRQQYKHANPTTWLQLPDANVQVRTVQRLGDVGIYKAAIPQTVIPPAVSGETYQRLERIREGAFEEFGVSRLAASAKKPGRLDSGAALREYRDQSTQRFAPQEKAFEQFVLDIIWLALAAAKKLADKGAAPVVIKRLARGPKKLRWSDVDLGEVRCQMHAAATLSRTPAGRTQMVLEWAQAGIISQDEARRLLAPFDPLDLDKAMSLYTAALDDIDMSIESVLEGEVLVPEPFQNLKIGVWRFQQAYLRASQQGADDEILENLRQWIVQGSFILAKQAQDAAAPVEPPQQATPVTAMAPEARQIAGIG